MILLNIFCGIPIRIMFIHFFSTNINILSYADMKTISILLCLFKTKNYFRKKNVDLMCYCVCGHNIFTLRYEKYG